MRGAVDGRHHGSASARTLIRHAYRWVGPRPHHSPTPWPRPVGRVGYGDKACPRTRSAAANGCIPAHGIVRPRGLVLDRVDDWLSIAIAAAGPRHAIGGWASGRLQGVVHVDGVRRGCVSPVLVHCLDGAQLRRRPQIRPSEAWLHDEELIEHECLRVSSLARAAFDEICDAPSLDDAVMTLDSFVAVLRGGAHTTVAAVARTVSRHPKHRGIVQARGALRAGVRSARSAPGRRCCVGGPRRWSNLSTCASMCRSSP